jgi:tripartite-type tricarboxylate transporter receptor subunit TctC
MIEGDMRNILFATAVATALLPAMSVPLPAQELPRTIKVVVPFPPGGSADTLLRVVSENIAKSSGRSVVVENRPGAGTVIANEAVARAPADGGTVLNIANSFIINRHMRTVNYDPLAFVPICLLVSSPQLIAVNVNSPYKTLAELIAAAKAKPGELNIAANGPGTVQHLAAELFKRSAGLDMTYVPYPGGAPAVNALLGAHVTTVLANYIEFAPQIAGDKVRALATTNATRLAPLPNVPTVRELGFAFDQTAWFGVAAPPQTPPAIIDALTKLFVAALDAPDVKATLTTQGLYPVGLCGAKFGDFLRNESEVSGKAVREAGIKAN